MQNQYELLKNEIKTFREEGHKFFNKELSVGDFKKNIWWNGSLCTKRRREVHDKTSYKFWATTS